MSLILNIDTSSENASVSLAENGENIVLLKNAEQKEHAGWIHQAIKQVVEEANVSLQQLQAISVTAGPGSYTGLRVGMSTAKGLCFALDIPLITENTLRVIALATRENIEGQYQSEKILLCPMIDARRMEVFTSIFNYNLQEKMSSTAMILDHQSFSEYLDKYQMIFSGNGSRKLEQMMQHSNAIYSDVQYSAVDLAQLSQQKFLKAEFSDVIYAEPMYLKEFYTVSKK